MVEKEEIGEEEVLSEGEEEKPQDTGQALKKREEMNMDDLEGKFLDLKIGTTVELVTQKLEKVEDDKYHLSNSQNADGKPYKVEVTDQDGQVLSVTAWDLWNKMRVAFKDLNALAPVTLRIKHPAHSAYEVEYLKKGKWVKAELSGK